MTKIITSSLLDRSTLQDISLTSKTQNFLFYFSENKMHWLIFAQFCPFRETLLGLKRQAINYFVCIQTYVLLVGEQFATTKSSGSSWFAPSLTNSISGNFPWPYIG